MAKIAFLCPVSDVVRPKVFRAALGIMAYSCKRGIEIENIGITERVLIHTARNTLAKEFLKTNCEWAFWMDSDMILPPDTIERLLKTASELDALFVTGVYYQRLGDHFPVLWKKDPIASNGIPIGYDPNTTKDKNGGYLHHYFAPKKDAKEPLRADACGFGCVLTHRKMFEKIPFPYFKTISDECSEDFYFSIQARNAGFKLWVDPTIETIHLGDELGITKKCFDVGNKTLVEVIN
jgi:GT2 family glycosyltransferase